MNVFAFQYFTQNNNFLSKELCVIGFRLCNSFFLMSNEISLNFKHILFNKCLKKISALEISQKERFRGLLFISLSGPFLDILVVVFCKIHHSKHFFFYIAFQNINSFLRYYRSQFLTSSSLKPQDEFLSLNKLKVTER